MGDHEADRQVEAHSHRTGRLRRPDGFREPVLFVGWQATRGCAIDKRWLSNLGKLIGKVRVWERSAEPQAQLPPKHVYIHQLPKGSSMNFVVLDNDSILMPAGTKVLSTLEIRDGRFRRGSAWGSSPSAE